MFWCLCFGYTIFAIALSLSLCFALAAAHMRSTTVLLLYFPGFATVAVVLCARARVCSLFAMLLTSSTIEQQSFVDDFWCNKPKYCCVIFVIFNNRTYQGRLVVTRANPRNYRACVFTVFMNATSIRPVVFVFGHFHSSDAGEWRILTHSVTFS